MEKGEETDRSQRATYCKGRNLKLQIKNKKEQAAYDAIVPGLPCSVSITLAVYCSRLCSIFEHIVLYFDAYYLFDHLFSPLRQKNKMLIEDAYCDLNLRKEILLLMYIRNWNMYQPRWWPSLLDWTLGLKICISKCGRKRIKQIVSNTENYIYFYWNHWN